MMATSTVLSRRVPANAKFERILACATQVFCEKGYEGASIRDIAAPASLLPFN